MSAQPIEPEANFESRIFELGAAFAPMRPEDLAAVAAIEQSIYSAPWSEGNFADSLAAGYCAWVVRIDAGRAMGPASKRVIGYFILMPAVDEAHILNVSVAREWQHRGVGRALLEKIVEIASGHRAATLILEVRPSNVRALEVYRRFGFSLIGVRPRYYPASAADQQSREDALVMKRAL